MARALCTICGWKASKAHGRCPTCLTYWNRNGHDRPARLIVRHGQRWAERLAS